MRVILILVLSVFMGNAAAINKCELNGKVYYQSATCPKHAKVKYLVDGEYIDEERLLKLKQEKKDNMPTKQSTNSVEKSRQVSNPDESVEDQFQYEDEQQIKLVKNAPHVNVPRAFDYVNPKLSNMQRQLDEHNRELQKLQNAR